MSAHPPRPILALSPLLLALALALAPLPAAAAPATDDAAAPDPASAQQEELYLAALRLLADGRRDEAAGLLSRFVEQAPRHAGAWLELAITQCELGHAAEALRLFDEIEARFAPPPGILEVIRDHRARGCAGYPPPADRWALTLGRGYDNNVNQGASSRYFSPGGVDQPGGELTDDYLPKADHYALASLDYTHSFRGDMLGFVQVRARRHDDVGQQDTYSTLAGVERPWSWRGWNGRVSGALGVVSLDGHFYQRQAQLQLRATPPLALPDKLNWSLTGGVNFVNYPTRDKYDAGTLELGSTLSYRGKSWQALGSGGVLSDRGQAGRLGGDRRGWYGSALALVPLGDYLDGELSWLAQNWRGSEAYSPGIIDQVRRQQTRQLRAALSLPLQGRHSLLLEWRVLRNKENISLFDYNSRSLQLSWRWDNY